MLLFVSFDHFSAFIQQVFIKFWNVHFTFPFLVVCNYRKVKRMEIFIKGTPEEIAALARELQRRHEADKVVDETIRLLQAASDRNEPVFQP